MDICNMVATSKQREAISRTYCNRHQKLPLLKALLLSRAHKSTANRGPGFQLSLSPLIWSNFWWILHRHDNNTSKPIYTGWHRPNPSQLPERLRAPSYCSRPAVTLEPRSYKVSQTQVTLLFNWKWFSTMVRLHHLLKGTRLTPPPPHNNSSANVLRLHCITKLGTTVHPSTPRQGCWSLCTSCFPPPFFLCLKLALTLVS